MHIEVFMEIKEIRWETFNFAQITPSAKTLKDSLFRTSERKKS